STRGGFSTTSIAPTAHHADTFSVRSVFPPTIQRSVKLKFFIARAAAPAFPASRGSTRTIRTCTAEDSHVLECGGRGCRTPNSLCLRSQEVRMRHLRFALPLVLLLVASSAIAQTTGGLIGQVTDSSGASLPGVTVEVRSPSLQGMRSN